MVNESLKAAEMLENGGISAKVVNIFTLKPIDKDLLIECAQKTGAIVITTVFEHETGLLEELFGIFSSAPQPSVAESVKEQVRGRLLERNSPVPMLR